MDYSGWVQVALIILGSISTVLRVWWTRLNTERRRIYRKAVREVSKNDKRVVLLLYAVIADHEYWGCVIDSVTNFEEEHSKFCKKLEELTPSSLSMTPEVLAHDFYINVRRGLAKASNTDLKELAKDISLVQITMPDKAIPAVHIQAIASNQKFSIGCFSYPPLINWHREQLGQSVPEFDGPWITLIRELAVRMDFDVDFHIIGASHFANSSRIEADLVLGLFKTDHRTHFFDFSVPIHRIKLQGVCKAASPKITKDDLIPGNLKIVVQEGEVGWEYVTQELKRSHTNSNVYTINSIATYEMLDLLISGRYDLAIADEVSCMHFLRGVGAEDPFRLAFDRPLQIFDTCLAAKKSLGWDIEEVNRHLSDIRNSKSFTEYEVQCLRGFEHIIERCSLI